MSIPSFREEGGPEEVLERLRRDLGTIAEAHRKPNDGGLPETHGTYAWWMSPGAVPGVTGPPDPTEHFELLYVSIAPKNAHSKATLRSRIRGQHLGGNIGSSTFRQSLAALLFEDHGWMTRSSGSRALLVPEHNRALVTGRVGTSACLGRAMLSVEGRGPHHRAHATAA